MGQTIVFQWSATSAWNDNGLFTAGGYPTGALRVLCHSTQKFPVRAWQATTNNRLPQLDSFLHREEGLDCPHCVIVDALRYGASVRRFYHLHAWVIMPNHVHVIFQPLAEMSEVMRWLKGRTARLANPILGRTGTTFWQNESFDHWIRSPEELQDLIAYVENNPVKAGLVDVPRQWRWSSAGFMADDKKRSSAPPEM